MKRAFFIFLIVSFVGTQPGILPAQTLNRVTVDKNKNASRGSISTFVGHKSLLEEGEEVELGSIPVGGPGQQSQIYYNVHILGEVRRPGSYKVLPSDRVTDAIKYAGGVSENGSQRVLQLRRSNGTQTLNLFAYKFNGMLSENPYLIENDVVFVPLKKGEFEIQGPVGRPGQYEIIRPISLFRAVAMAGGFTVGRAVKDPIRVVRFDADEKKEILEVNNTEDAIKGFTVQKGDIVVIPHVLISKNTFDYNVQRLPGDNIFYPTINDSVYVVGSVSMPGPYPFQPSYSVNDYVSQAGPDAKSNMRRAKVISADGKQRSAKKADRINPGETILVPARTITASNFISWFGTLTSIALTTFVFIDRFSN